DRAKTGGIVVIECSRRGWKSIFGESRKGEVRMIGQVEEFGSKLHPETFAQLELLKEREVQSIEARSTELTGPTAQRTVIGLPDGLGDWRRGEGCRVHPMSCIMRSGIQIHPRNLQGIAAEAGCRRDGAWDRARLAGLQSINPVGIPTAQDRV